MKPTKEPEANAIKTILEENGIPEEIHMENTHKKDKLSADVIAEKAMNGEDISPYFSNKGEMKPAIQRVNVDFTVDMIKELDSLAKELNVSRQAVIKTYLRQSLDQHYSACKRAS